MTLQVENLSGGYGQTTVIQNINFTIPAGSVTALIGLNGSGKSTIINHLIGLLAPKTGSVVLNSHNLAQDPVGFKKQIAYVPEQPVLYEELNLQEHIQAMINIYHLDEKTSWEEATRLLKIFRLDDKLNWFPTHFSKGMRQKVMIVMAFITQANLFIIDEPFLGLDVLAVQDLLTLIDEKRESGASLLITTHVMSTLKAHADQYIYLEQGQIVASGAIDAISDQVPVMLIGEEQTNG
ncbi:ABC transporter ATP-binding protein [Weissella viridescens]|uniref:ABC transporter ATP-binding protein n=1 Tax=Weissella viridescens TaxID=1629 RepID=UPI001D07BD95|nr:ABC transporter ATP-binding protein [Weissella viridescens]MCB6839529.1 ABC transporter ATP-binding protein [Weissella viridescens]MCB6846260.1 ABC transporter ATP-binding protein [Weissella viridescens]